MVMLSPHNVKNFRSSDKISVHIHIMQTNADNTKYNQQKINIYVIITDFELKN